MERLELFKDTCVEWLTRIWQSVLTLMKPVLDILEPLRDKLNQMFDFLGTLRDSLFDWFTRLIEGVRSLPESFRGWFDSLIDGIKGIPDKFKDLLVLLFIPDGDPFRDIKALLDDKFYIITQVKELVSAAVFSGSGTPPSFEVSFMGVTAPIVNFDIFRPYLSLIHGIVTALCYYRYFRSLYRRLPSLIGGFH